MKLQISRERLKEMIEQGGEEPSEFTATPASAAEPDSDVRRAADALLGTLWQLAYSGKRTHEENWQEMDRRFPQARWLHEALKAASTDEKPLTIDT